MKISEHPLCKNCPMINIEYDYEKAGKKLHHSGKEMNFVPVKIGNSLRLSVWEAAGETENDKMEPAVGAAGKFGDRLYKKAGINRDAITIINCINCRPPNNIFPTDSAARKYISQQDGEKALRQCYFAHVEPLLLSRKWERIDILGAHALRLLTGLSDILKWRGSPLEVDTDEIRKRLDAKS